MLLSQFDKLLTDENFQRDVLDHVLYVELRFAGEPPLTRHPATEQLLERTASLPPEIATVPRPISPATSGGTASSIARAWPVQMATNESSGIASPSPADAIPMQSSQDAVAANNAPSTEEAIIPEVAPDETSTSAAPSSAEMTAAQVAQDATRMDVAPPAGAAMALRMAPVEVRTSASPARAEARLLEYATGRSMETYEIDESRSSISSDPYYSLKLKGGIIALLDTGVNVVSEQTLLPETEIGQFDCLNDDDPYCALHNASRDVGNDDVDAVPGIPHGDGTRSAAVITSRNMTDNQVDATPDSPGDYRGVTGIQINSYKVYKAHGCDSDDPCCIDTGAATKALHALADGLRPDDQRPEDAPPFHDVIPAARTSTCPSATCKG